jgi:hypothetical protein
MVLLMLLNNRGEERLLRCGILEYLSGLIMTLLAIAHLASGFPFSLRVTCSRSVVEAVKKCPSAKINSKGLGNTSPITRLRKVLHNKSVKLCKPWPEKTAVKYGNYPWTYQFAGEVWLISPYGHGNVTMTRPHQF